MKAIIEESRESRDSRSRSDTTRVDIHHGTTEQSPLLEHRRRARKSFSDSNDMGHQDLTIDPRVRQVNRTITVEPVVILFYISFNASVPGLLHRSSCILCTNKTS